MSEHALSLLKDQLIEQEQQAVKAFIQAQQEHRNFEQQLQTLESYRQSYLDQALETGIAGIKAQGLRHYQHFIGKLDEAAEQQRQLLEKLLQGVAEKRLHWQKLQTKRRSIEMLLEKKAMEKARIMEKTEQKHLDQYALFSYLRNKGQLE